MGGGKNHQTNGGGKGSKGGKKGGKGERGRDREQDRAAAKERQWERERQWDRATFGRCDDRDIWDDQPTFTIISELEDRRSSDELERILTEAEDKLNDMDEQLADESKLKAEQEAVRAQLQKDIEAHEARKAQEEENMKFSEQSIESTRQLADQINEKIKAIGHEKDQLKIRKKQLREKQREAGLHSDGKNEQQALDAIKEVEHEMETRGSMNPRIEKQYMQKLKKLNQIRDGIRDMMKLDAKFAEKDGEIKLCQKELKEIQEEKHQIKKKERESKDLISSLDSKIMVARRKQEQSGVKELHAAQRRQCDFVNLITHKVGYRAAKSKYEAALAEWEKQKEEYMVGRREQEKEMKAQDKERQAEFKEEQAKRRENPWAEEKVACKELLAYMEELIEKNGLKEEKKEKKEAKEEAKEEKKEEAKDNEEGEAEEKKEGEEGEKKEKEEWFEPNEEEKKTKEEPILRHEREAMSQFDLLKLPLPTTERVKQLKDRMEFFDTAAWDAKLKDLRGGRKGGKGRGGKGGKKGKGGKGGYKGGKRENRESRREEAA